MHASVPAGPRIDGRQHEYGRSNQTLRADLHWRGEARRIEGRSMTAHAIWPVFAKTGGDILT
jgi:hypothetical protein